LAQADTDVAGAVADDDNRAEAEPPAALDDLGDAVDLDDAFLEGELVGVNTWHGRSSEIQAGFAGGFGKGLDAPVVPEPGPIEHHFANAGCPCPLGDDPPDGRCLDGLRC